ncbi:uncharacterized protein LOC103307998 [Acyrthosiphon pisum]|uniref:Uncharacterized protein n=1 Tax=Acyrthosiphon pisum TaxID=7029 RepID=A0A8R2H599_ACYPI|nr:uncharacterized protein LOC103307998 [Acyrthosiphon pisum]|eukprot:XP_016656479.1 PREDICTED: uncharacterized protein LOC103307998 [Acyrthosiphon pisum]
MEKNSKEKILWRCRRKKIIVLILYYDSYQKDFYTLSFDETTNSTGSKELEIAVKYWSESKGLIVHHHLQLFLIRKATGEDLFEKLKKALDNAHLPLNMRIHIGSDGPNVNKKVYRLMNGECLAVRNQKLLNIGFCNIHLLHNAFCKGISVLGEEASDLIILIHNYFTGLPSRWDDFEQIQRDKEIPNLHFVKHCPSRWLTIENTAARLIQQWDAVVYYFLKFVPQIRSILMKS